MPNLIQTILDMLRFMSLPAETRQALIKQAENQIRLRKAIKTEDKPIAPKNEYRTIRYPNGYWKIEWRNA